MRIQYIDREEFKKFKSDYNKAVNEIEEKCNNDDYKFYIDLSFDCYSDDRIAHYTCNDNNQITANSVCELLNLFDKAERDFQYAMYKKVMIESDRDDVKISITPCDVYLDLRIFNFVFGCKQVLHKRFQILYDDATKLKEWCDTNLKHSID